MLPFGLFTTQIPYVILGVIYLVYVGLALLNKPDQSEYQDIKVQHGITCQIQYVERSCGADLPVINIINHSFIHHGAVTGGSVCDIADFQYAFRQYRTRNQKRETLTPIFQNRNVSFDLFSRPPPVTA